MSVRNEEFQSSELCLLFTITYAKNSFVFLEKTGKRFGSASHDNCKMKIMLFS